MISAPSIVVSSYNQPNALARVFAGILGQTGRIGELLVADDGSQADTTELVQELARQAPFPVHFTTQDDLGFRKAKAQNNALRRIRGEHILFLDGDCVPPPGWSSRYAQALAEGNDFAVAGCVYLTGPQSHDLTAERIRAGQDDWQDQLCKDSDLRLFHRMHRREWVYRLLGKRNKPRIKGGNWAATRGCLLAVNGFDEMFAGFGKEDSDIRNRLRNAGFCGRSLWDRNWVYHCSHQLDERRQRPQAQRVSGQRDYYDTRRRASRCEHGIEACE